MIKIDLMINNLRFGQLNNWREYHSATHRSLHTDDLASLDNSANAHFDRNHILNLGFFYVKRLLSLAFK